MTRKRLIYVCLLALLAAIALAGYVLPWETAGSQPQKSLLQNSGGPVVFEHEKHVATGAKCIDCHHELSVSAQPMKCDSCHKAVFDDAFRANHAKDYPATSCAVCHHYRNERRDCALCHAGYKAAGKDWGHAGHGKAFGCEACHHAEANAENCARCHRDGTPPSMGGAKPLGKAGLADAAHARCAVCHGKWFDQKAQGCERCHAGKNLDGNGARTHANAAFSNCANCHVNVESPQKLMPGSMQALHKLCMGCHAAANAGPRTREDCSKCHLK